VARGKRPAQPIAEIEALLYDAVGSLLMLPDERTTNRNELPLPSQVEGLVVAPNRNASRPLVTFLRAEDINVRTAFDADAAFEEALLHPPDVIVLDDRIAPAGGIELTRRLKANVRTHFVPVVLYALNDLRQHRVKALAAGVDAVFVPATEADERRARLWALLRTRALYRRFDRRQRSQKTEIVERRHWLQHFLHDLKGHVAALSANIDYLSKFGPAPTDPQRADFDDSVADVRGVFEQLRAGVRTVLDYDRFESGQLTLRETRFLLGEAAAEAIEPLRRYGAIAGREVTLTCGAGEHLILGDRELLSAAILNLGFGALRRSGARAPLTFEVVTTDVGTRLRVSAPGQPLQPAERAALFDPYRHGAGSAIYGIGLALARAVVELHEGRIWVEDVPGGGCAFVFELDDKRGTARPKRAPERGAAS
jgi:K+-sensing histidine kinase KdpD